MQIYQDLSLLPPKTEQELWRWLYGEIRTAILNGRLKRGSRLPSTRHLAKQYGLSRGTVATAFEQLQAEGYTLSERGSGTFVAPRLPDQFMTASRQRPPVSELPKSNAKLSSRVRQMIKGVRLLPASRSPGLAFRHYEPAIDLFPTDLWARIAGRVLRRAPRSLYGPGNIRGYDPLRKAIAEYLGTARGVRCDPQQIIITAGAQQALDLAARVLLDPGDRVWIEDPCYPGARFALRASGAELIPVPVDKDGLKVEAGQRLAPVARIAYTTPANQFPLGATMSVERRLALLQWAVKTNAWIVEDEYDAEYRYFGHPVAALQTLDASGCVIHIGTFTKLLFNALRLGYLVVPESLVDSFEAVRSFIDRHPPTLDQAILAEFMLDGHFGHHVRRMRQVYAERILALREAAEKHLGGVMDVVDAVAGMRTIGWIKTEVEDRVVAQRARSLGLEVTALSEFTLRHRQPAGLVLGFAGCRPGELRRGVEVLAAVFRKRGFS